MAITKIRTKLLSAFLLVALIPIVILATYAIIDSRSTIESITAEKLSAVRDSKKQALENYFDTVNNQISSMANNEAIIDAIGNLTIYYSSFGSSDDGMDTGDDSELVAQSQALKDYWEQQFNTEYKKQNDRDATYDFSLLSDQAIRLQYAFIANNPHPLGSKNELVNLENEGLYGYNKYHNMLHPWLNGFLQRFGYYDIFLIDKSGRVVYSVYKELDFATSLEKGPWQNSGLAQAYQSAKELEKGQTFFTDLESYTPSYNAPAAFVSTPIYKTTRQGNERRIGTLVYQMPLERITNTMSQRTGLGETGDSYLIGPDYRMRSDSYNRPDTHNVIASFRNEESGTLNNEAVTQALEGKTDITHIIDQDIDYLTAFSPFEYKGIQWAMVTEMSSEEAYASIANLKQGIIVSALVMLLIIALFAIWIASNLSSPIIKLTEQINAIRQSFDFSKRANVTSKDEIGEAAEAFNALLSETQNAFGLVNNTMQKIAHGQFNERINNELTGDLKTLKEGVNASAESVDITMQSLTKVMQAIENGSFNMRLDNSVKGEFRDKVNNAMETLEHTIDQTANLFKKLSHGDLDARISGDLKGDLAELKTDANLSIEQLKKAFSAINQAVLAQSKGDLSQRIELKAEGEIDRLTHSFNSSADQLEQAFMLVRQIAHDVHGSSHNISGSMQDLNHRTQAQAASLEETASAIEELTSTTNQNTAHAQEADKLAKKALKETEAGRRVMQESEQAIQQIHESSKKIEEITGLIDSIAFQTNLLALNAAVEAARAGEHGRGFAVVAGEVRNLAGKSADAAREIKTLIENTVRSIQEGTRKIDETGTALAEINQSIQEVAQTVSEIAIASQEQQQGIYQVNQAITEIDHNTQHNATLVETTNDNTLNMSQQSSELTDAVSKFKLSAKPLIKLN